MIEQALLDIGLSEKEINIYIASLKLGSQPVSLVAKQANVNRTTAYVILKGLFEKGLVSKYLKGDVWFFTATQPENLSIYVDRKKKELDLAQEHLGELVPELRKLMTYAHEGAMVQLFEGLDGVKMIYDQTLKLKAPISEYLLDYNCDLRKMWDFWDVYISRRVALDIPMRLLITDDELGIRTKKKDPAVLRRTRLVPKERFPHGNNLIMIFGDHYAYFSYADDKFVGALIHDKYLASMEQSIFDFVWDSAKAYDDKLAKKYKLPIYD